MEHFLGITALLSTAFIVFLCARRWPASALVLTAAFGIRAIAALTHFYIVPLPDSQADALKFEVVAASWAKKPIGWQFLEDHSYFISWLIALFYRVTDRSLLLAQSFSVLFGTLTVLSSWLSARELWGRYIADKAAWFITFFPTLILYSALTMREAYIWFFLSIGILGVVRWLRTRSFEDFVLVVIGFVGGSAFHGGISVGLIVFCGLIIVERSVRFFRGLLSGRFRLVSLTLACILTVPLALYICDIIPLPKLGRFSGIIHSELLFEQVGSATRGGAMWPAWTIPTSPSQLVWKAPIRVGFFLFSPFPWEVQETQHLLGMFDGLLYIMLIFFIWRNRRLIWEDRRARWVATIMAVIILVFAFGVGNFGTAARHRAKVVSLLMILAAPCLPRVVMCATDERLRTAAISGALRSQ